MQRVDFRSNSRKELAALATIGILICFILGFLITHEVSLEDSLKLCAILALDLITGVIIWVLLSQKNEYSVFELFGVGVALGTSLNAIGQLVFRETYFSSLFNYALLSLVVIIFIQWRRKNLFKMQLTPTRYSTVLAVCSTALVLLCGDRYYLWAGVLILFLATIALTKSERNSSDNKSKYLYIVLSVGSIALAFFSASILESAIFGPRSTTSYISDWDGVYAEASSKSITVYGPFDNIFLANTKNAYYWFSYAWSGSITGRSKVSDWIVTTQFGFIIVALATMSIVVAILQSVSGNKQVGLLPLVVVAATSLIGSSNFLLDTASFSQCISILYLAVAYFAAKEILAHPNLSNTLLMALSVSLLALTKLTVAIPFISALCLFVVLIWFVGASQKQKIFLSLGTLVSGIVSLFVFFVFIKQQTVFQNSQSEFVIRVVPNVFGIGTGIVLIDIGLLLVLKFPIFYGQFRNRDLFVNLMTFVILTSLSMSLVISSSWVSQANIYLLLPFSLGVGLVVSVRLIQEQNKLIDLNFKGHRLFYLAAMSGVGLGFVTTILLLYFNGHYVTNYYYYLLISLIPLISVIPIGVISFLNPATTNRQKFFSLLTVAFLASSAGSFVAHSLRSVEQKIIFTKNNWDLPVIDIELREFNLHGAITFILIRSNLTDVIADNSSSDMLIVASTGVRSYASTYGQTFSIAHDDRFIAQEEFAKNPILSNYKYLRNGCVTWFYYDKKDAPGKPKTFKPYATTMYEDEFGAVLKLSESYPLPKECLE